MRWEINGSSGVSCRRSVIVQCDVAWTVSFHVRVNIWVWLVGVSGRSLYPWTCSFRKNGLARRPRTDIVGWKLIFSGQSRELMFRLHCCPTSLFSNRAIENCWVLAVQNMEPSSSSSLSSPIAPLLCQEDELPDGVLWEAVVMMEEGLSQLN